MLKISWPTFAKTTTQQNDDRKEFWLFTLPLSTLNA